MTQIMRDAFAKAIALLPLAAAAMTYPPYEIYTGTTSGSPQLNYTKVCDPGRTGEASASYVTMGSLYPARPALVNTAYAGKVTIPAYIGGLPVRRINDAAFIACQNITDVEIPATVREIGARAFSDCWNLTNVTFAAGPFRCGGRKANLYRLRTEVSPLGRLDASPLRAGGELQFLQGAGCDEVM